MQAVQATQFGDPATLELVTGLPDPTPGPERSRSTSRTPRSA